MLDFEWNILVYDHAGLGLENVGPDGKMLDLAGYCWIRNGTCWDMTMHTQLGLGNVGFGWIMLDLDWIIQDMGCKMLDLAG